jgi:hypothetical protein
MCAVFSNQASACLPHAAVYRQGFIQSTALLTQQRILNELLLLLLLSMLLPTLLLLLLQVMVQQLAELEEIIEYRRLVLQGQGGSNVAADVLNGHADVAMGVSTGGANDMMVPGGRGTAPVRSSSYTPPTLSFRIFLYLSVSFCGVCSLLAPQLAASLSYRFLFVVVGCQPCVTSKLGVELG